jgi:hypothetical protein
MNSIAVSISGWALINYFLPGVKARRVSLPT